MSRYYTLLLSAIFILFAFTLGVLLYVTPTKQSSMQKGNILNSNNGVRLFFSPNPLFLLYGAESKVDLMIDTRGAKVESVQAELSFDPGVISTIQFVQPSDSLFPLSKTSVDLNDIRYLNGRISYAVSVKPGIEPITGEGKIATLNLVASRYPRTNYSRIKFIGQSSVLSDENNKSILKETFPLTISFITSSPSSQLNPFSR